MGTTVKSGMLAALFVIGSISTLGCSSDDSEDGSNRGNNPNLGMSCSLDADCGAGLLCVSLECVADPNASNGDIGGGGPGNGGDNGFNTLMDQTPGATIDTSFIWIANSDQGTVSKIDTRTLTELGRYTTSPTGAGMPSRTSVAASGDVAVANRGGVGAAAFGGGCFSGFEPACSMMAAPGGGTETGVTKIWSNVDNCVDANGNGTIETSSGGNDILAWGTDECVAWHTVIPHWSNRPLAWAPPQGPDATLEMVWTAGATTCTNTGCQWTVYRLHGNTGAIEDTVEFSNAGGMPFVGPGVITNYGPYGGASDAAGNFWGFVGNTTHLFYVDAMSLQTATWPIPRANGYGLTIDSVGRIHLCGNAGMSRFDPGTATWTENASVGGTTTAYNGCMTDGKGTLWVGGGVDFGASGLHAFDTETLQLNGSYDVGAVKGVSIDIDGFVWGVGGAGSTMAAQTATQAFKLDPASGQAETFNGLVGAYSYSDMTGFGLAQAGYEPVVLE